jgi:predicted glycosyltransferase involved in capsule biosynthesis
MPNTTTPVLSYIVPLYFDQENDRTLIRVLTHYSKYDQKLLDQIHFILVDDCSPIKIKLPPISNLNISILRITSDIPWNQGGARNLGVDYAKTTKMILTDIDHIFPERTLNHLIKRPYKYAELIKFRRFRGWKKIDSGYNIFYINKPLFTDFHGYDEIFCGRYGHEDTHFFESIEKAAIPVIKLSNWFSVTDLVIDRQKEYHTLVRDTRQNLNLLNQKRSAALDWHTGLSLNFEWEVSEEHFVNSNP